MRRAFAKNLSYSLAVCQRKTGKSREQWTRLGDHLFAGGLFPEVFARENRNGYCIVSRDRFSRLAGRKHVAVMLYKKDRSIEER
jgi:hypothetical protein